MIRVLSHTRFGNLALWFLVFSAGWISASEPDTLAASGKGRTLVIPITDNDDYMVDQVQADFILTALDRAETAQYDRVVLTIDTYGGMLMAARDIADRLLRMKIPTVAYVETKAISAGVFIAWSCDMIVMEAASSMGDAQMVYPTMEGGIEEAPEKHLTLYRSDWRKSSDLKNRPQAVAQAFFDKDVELLQVGTANDFQFMARKDYDLLTENERQPIMKVVVEAGKLLTFHAEEAASLGLVTVTKDFAEFLEITQIDAADIDRYDMNTNQKILRYLGNNSWIFLILTLIGLNGIYMEIKAPGFGIPGLTALVCFTIVFGARFFLGTAAPMEMVLFVVGILLCVVEIFVLPGLGIAGITGIVFMLGALVLARLPDFGVPVTELPWEWVRESIAWVLGAFIASIASMVLLVPLVLKIPAVQNKMLPLEQHVEDGYVFKTVDDSDSLIGLVGQVEGCLRPIGKIRLEDGRLLEVSSMSGYQDDGVQVRISQIDGNIIHVRRDDDHANAVQV